MSPIAVAVLAFGSLQSLAICPSLLQLNHGMFSFSSLFLFRRVELSLVDKANIPMPVFMVSGSDPGFCALLGLFEGDGYLVPSYMIFYRVT